MYHFCWYTIYIVATILNVEWLIEKYDLSHIRNLEKLLELCSGIQWEKFSIYCIEVGKIFHIALELLGMKIMGSWLISHGQLD